ncbi:precorrin-6Y methyltransferase [Salipiger aestuarii]|uniref:precorrin-6y C5,15-methyltransferase (decarboxylating) subunit CbiE n=1 Tax=Salipiger aestuarii TaxID=568098 RepID=UPI00123C1DF3|nr:precorrin-6y C5,15-methyltransferase (decarboxylating) subunit CbiE [Salipiger aestuarii]KAA8607822.1 precorrin-6Y methyltransferase [Salipiger aestuarii]KAA8610496.1 precorrin-6Y methyltransferase [Salipiger aestuarii]
MSDAPWLTIIGLGEDGPDGLGAASRAALERAEIVMGPARHLSLIPDSGARRIPWPVPFADGIERLIALRGQRVVALASGDPFWFGAGAVLARRLARGEWRAFPGASVFALAAARMGWPLETTDCLGLHAAPLTRMRPRLAPGKRMIVLLRDGAAVAEMGAYLGDLGFGPSQVTVMECLGGPRERVSLCRGDALADRRYAAPVCAAVDIAGDGAVVSLASGRADDWYDHDGQITKRPVRALTLSALAPRPCDHLWDIGGGSGSIGIEWLLCDPTLTATAIEPRPERAARIAANATRLGVDRLRVVTGHAPPALSGLAPPDAVFVGGGLGADLLDHLMALPGRPRIVANAVTLETQSLLVAAHARHGGDLLRAELSSVTAIGTRRGWKPAFPIMQWSRP